MNERHCSIFISHAAIDDELAKFLKESINAALPNLNVFVSSDPQNLKLADEWVRKILKALGECELVLVLATERGLSRKWVWFEAGRTWFSGIKMVPCCVGTQRKSSLPAPFSDRQGANLDESNDVRRLFDSLAAQFGELAEAPNLEEIAKTMARLDIRAEERQKISVDPISREQFRLVEQQMKTLSPAMRETIRQFVIFGELSTGAARFKVQNSGANMDQFLVPEALSERTGWLVSKPGNDPFDNTQTNVYVMNPEIRVLLKDYFFK